MFAKVRLSACILLLLAIAASAHAQRVLDLATPSGTKITVTAPPGEVVTFSLVNKLPVGAVYNVTIEEKPIPIPVFDTPSEPLGGVDDERCDPILEEAKTLANAANEVEVAKIVRSARMALASGTCKSTAHLAKINEWLSLTIQVLSYSGTVRAGVEIILTVTRDQNIWTVVVSGGPRGMWLTTYGVSVVPSRDEPHFAKALEGDTFAITRESELDDVRMIPSLFFSWLPRKRMAGDFSFGPTAGLGLSKTRPAIFGGVGLTYNWNLAFIGGLAISPHTRLRGRYTEGEEISEALSDEQINREVFRPTWLFALTFRFGSNPFGAGGEAAEAAGASEGEKKKQLAEEEKKKKAEEEKKKKGEGMYGLISCFAERTRICSLMPPNLKTRPSAGRSWLPRYSGAGVVHQAGDWIRRTSRRLEAAK